VDTESFSLPDTLKIERINSINQINEKDLKMLTESRSDLMGSAASILIRERFDKGAVLWLLKENGHLAGYRWTIANNHVTPTHVPHTETDVHSIGAELFDGFRGRYLFDMFLRGTFIILKSDGFKRFYSETYLWNKRAIKAILKTGLSKIGTATMISIFGKTFVIWHEMSSKIEIE